MTILLWIVLGLVAGALAKLIMPGKQGGGIIATLALGLVGALIGGFLLSLITRDFTWQLNPWSILTAVVGALIALFIYGKITGSRAS